MSELKVIEIDEGGQYPEDVFHICERHRAEPWKAGCEEGSPCGLICPRCGVTQNWVRIHILICNTYRVERALLACLDCEQAVVLLNVHLLGGAYATPT